MNSRIITGSQWKKRRAVCVAEQTPATEPKSAVAGDVSQDEAHRAPSMTPAATTAFILCRFARSSVPHSIVIPLLLLLFFSLASFLHYISSTSFNSSICSHSLIPIPSLALPALSLPQSFCRVKSPLTPPIPHPHPPTISTPPLHWTLRPLLHSFFDGQYKISIASWNRSLGRINCHQDYLLFLPQHS